MKRSRISFVRFTAARVAGRLRISVRRARRLIVSGPLEGMRIGRRLFVEFGALERYRAEQGRAA